MNRLNLICVAIAIATAGVTAAEVHAATVEVHAPPEAPCKFENRMDLAITGEGVWFECVCEALIVGTVCDWYELGPAPDAATIRRRSWRYVSRATQKQLLVVHRWPRFVDPPKRIAKPATTTKIVVTPGAAAASAAGKCSDPFLADDAWAQTHGC